MPSGAGSPVDTNVLRVAYTAVFTGLLATMDSTVVVVALGSISDELKAPLPAAQWVVTGYLLALALSLPVSGWLVDRIGARRSFLVAVTAFAVTSVVCAAAPTLPVLVGLRVAQGLAGGLLVPMGQVIVTKVTPDEQLGRVMSLVGAPAALGPVLGPVLGGFVTSIGSWRWVFLINLPIAAAALVQGVRRLPHDRPGTGSTRQGDAQGATGSGTRERLDVVGLVLVGPSLALLVYAMTSVSQPAAGGSSGALRWVLAAVGILLLAAFVGWSLHRPSSGPSAALVDLRLLRRRPFGPSVLVAFLSRAVGDGAVLLVALYLQDARGAGPLATGLLLLPQGLGAVAGLRLGGRLIDRRGARTTAVLGGIVLLLGTVPLAVSPTMALPILLVALGARGVGTSLIGLPPVAAAYQGLDRSRAPRATTTLNIAQRLGSPLGTAILVTVLTAASDSTPLPGFTHSFTLAAVLTGLIVPVSALLPARHR